MTGEEAAILAGKWPEALDIAILPGIGDFRRDGDAFAPTAEVVRESFEAEGSRAGYVGGDGTEILLLKSADWWGPVLMVGMQWLQEHGVETLAGILSKAISQTRDTSDTRAVVKVGRYRDDQTEVDWLSYDGPAGALPEALRAWAKRLR